MTTVDGGAAPGPLPGVRRDPEHKGGEISGRSARARPVALLLFAGAGGVGTVLSAQIASGGPLLTARWQLLTQLAAWALAWLVAVAAVFRVPRRAALPLIFLTAVALRVAALAGPPTTTDDFHRYSWDGRTQAAGVNPYEHPPDSAELAPLREAWLWPEERPCPLAYRPEACTRINRPSAPTIYPPAAEAWFAGIYRLTGIEDRWKPWQVAGLLIDVAVVALIATALRRRGRDPRWTALYALSPAPVLEMVNNGHVDGLAILLVVLALMLAPRHDLAAGSFIGLATLVKLFPALLIVALVAASPDRRSRALVRIGGVAGAVVAIGYLPHLFQVGTKVVGFLPGYLREEDYDGAGRYLVAGALHVPGGLAGVVSVLALGAAVMWIWTRRPAAPVGAAVLIGTLLLAASPAQPWYAVSLLAVATLAVEPVWAVVVAAGYPYYFAVILLHPERVGIGELAYGLAAGAVGATALLRRFRVSRHSMRGCAPSGC